ncbi:MAG: sulfatase-like hydrolase/transferase [Verrucomicrobiota bacterium]
MRLASLILFLLGLCATAAERPNILFIIVDDSEELDYACLGGEVLTPHIDQLANEGIRFRNGFTTSSVCTPTRYSCLTGQYASRAESLRTEDHQPDDLSTFVRWNTHMEAGGHNLASVLQADGYTTAMIGKWHVGHTADYRRKVAGIPRIGSPDKPRALDDPEANAYLAARYEVAVDDVHRHFGFDHVASFYSGNLTGTPKWMRHFSLHNQDWITKGALDFLDDHAGSEEPFFMYFSTTLQHGPPPNSSVRADRRITARGLIDEPPRVQPDADSIYRRIREAGLPESKASQLWFDDAIGAVMEKLREHDMAENTLVFLFSDQQSWGKGSCHDGGARTPYLLSWPARIPGGDQRHELVTNLDFAPTIFDACQVEVPSDMTLDGESLLPLFNENPPNWREAVFLELGNMRAVRTRDFKYIAVREISEEDWKKLPAEVQKTQAFRRTYFKLKDEWQRFDGTPHVRNSAVAQWRSDHAHHASDPDQLYDLRVDPSETVNLFHNREYQREAAAMKERLKAWLATMPGPYAEFKP